MGRKDCSNSQADDQDELMGKIAPFKRLQLVWEIRIAEDLPACLYGISEGSDCYDNVFKIGIYARSWEEADKIRPTAEKRAWEEYMKKFCATL